MKTMTLVMVLAAAIGCSKDKKATTMPTEDKTPVSAQEATPDQVKDDVPVSQSLSVANEILAACGITAAETANPTFDYDKEDLSAGDRQILEKVATCLISGPLKGRGVSMIGRADPRGTEEYNLGLGSRRAQSVSSYLARLGVSRPQLGVTTRGALDATGADEAGWQQDRRVDIQLRP